MMDVWYALPQWVQYLVYGISLCLLMCFSAVVLARAGRNPYWAVLTVLPVPFLFPVLIWIFSAIRWPKRD